LTYKNEISYRGSRGLKIFITTFLVVQILLPLRHHAIAGDVLWTEEGHRCAWRMMLRAKSASTQYTLVSDRGIQKIRLRDYVVGHQMSDVKWKPDVIWQLAQRIGDDAIAEGHKGVEIYVSAEVGVNGRGRKPLVDSTKNIYGVEWNYFGHQEWLLIAPWGL